MYLPPKVHCIYTASVYKDRIYATVNVNKLYVKTLKIDTGADACVITTEDLQDIPFPIKILPCNNFLRGYGGAKTENIGSTFHGVSFKDKTICTKFNIVEASGSPSMLGCSPSQELGIITANVDELTALHRVEPPRNISLSAEILAQEGKLSKSSILAE